MTCTITVDEIPCPILHIFLPPLGKNNRDESELSVRKHSCLLVATKVFSFQSLLFIGFVIAPVMCIFFNVTDDHDVVLIQILQIAYMKIERILRMMTTKPSQQLMMIRLYKKILIAIPMTS